MIPLCQLFACLALAVTGALETAQAPPFEDMPLFLSWYDPALCELGHAINCDSDPTVLAGSLPLTNELYGTTAACLPEWFDRRVYVPGIGWLNCWDTGGDVRVVYRETYTADGFVWGWVVVVDVLWHYEEPPSWQYSLAYDWRLEQ